MKTLCEVCKSVCSVTSHKAVGMTLVFNAAEDADRSVSNVLVWVPLYRMMSMLRMALKGVQVTDTQKGLVKEIEDLVSVQQFILQQGDEGVFVSLL